MGVGVGGSESGGGGGGFPDEQACLLSNYCITAGAYLKALFSVS